MRGISYGCRVADQLMSASLSLGSSRVRSSASNRRSNSFLAIPSGFAAIAFLSSGREWPSGGAWCVLTTGARIPQPGAPRSGSQAIHSAQGDPPREGRGATETQFIDRTISQRLIQGWHQRPDTNKVEGLARPAQAALKPTTIRAHVRAHVRAKAKAAWAHASASTPRQESPTSLP